jgi:tRNA(Ile)-lysidine synthase
LAAAGDANAKHLPVMDLIDEINLCLPGPLPARIGVGVSGGSDSTALLILLARWGQQHDVEVLAATVDHGLRVEAAAEAQKVAKLCRELKIDHQTLHWQDWEGKGNLQDQARQARRDLLGIWARDHQVSAIALGHTQDDQAETVLMRLVRGSGVDGLAGMARSSLYGGLRYFRPLLGVRRQRLRDILTDKAIAWSDDPSNDDTQFDRIKIRKLMAELAVSTQGLAETAERMQEARSFLEAQTFNLAQGIATVTKAGDVKIDLAQFSKQPLEMRQRLLAHSLKWVASSPYRPRLEGLQRLLAAIEVGQKSTLLGCVCETTKSGHIIVSREYSAVKDASCGVDQVWDHRWKANGLELAPPCTIAALGEAGLAQCPAWRETGLLRASLLASPSIWNSGVLVSAPIAAPLQNWSQNWQIDLVNQENSFFSAILSH